MRAAYLLVSGSVLACGPSIRSGLDDAAPATPDAAPSPDGGECHDVVDVVFVLDTSSSMGFVLSQLEQQIAQVVTASNTLAPDAHFGLIVFQDNHAIDATGPL